MRGTEGRFDERFDGRDVFGDEGLFGWVAVCEGVSSACGERRGVR